MKRLLFVFLLIMGVLNTSMAKNPSPLGIEIGNTTLDQVKNKYTCINTGINKFSLGPMCNLDVTQLNIEGLKKATVIADRKGTVVALILTFPKYKFNELFNTLSSKYTLLYKEIPFVGNKYAKFRYGNTIIQLDAPHLSFDLTLTYTLNSFLKEYYKAREKEEKQKKQNLHNNL